MGGLLQALLSGIDSGKRAAKNRIADLLANPSGFLSMVNDQAQNFNNAVVPTIENGSLYNRPLTQEEKNQRDMDTAMNVMPVGVGHVTLKGKIANPDVNLAKTAIKDYGKTANINEAGYILPDGAMLDFSGRHYSSPDNWPYLRGQRNVDHRELTDAVRDLLPNSDGGTTAMRDFMNQVNAVRNQPNVGFDTTFVPTDKQLKQLVKGWRGNPEPMYIDASHPETGDTIKSLEVQRPTVDKLRSLLDDAFKDYTPKATALPEAPQAEALRLAQQRAALPLEQNGLGLPANNTPMDRAGAMGFDMDMYHSTKNDPTVLLPRPPASSKRGTDFGVHVGDQLTANGAIIAPWHEKALKEQAARTDIPQSIIDSTLKDIQSYYENSQVLPLKVKVDNPLIAPDFGRWDQPNNMLSAIAKEKYPKGYQLKDSVVTNDRDALQQLVDSVPGYDIPYEKHSELHKQNIENVLKSRGYDSISYPNMTEGNGSSSYMLVNPDNIRSRFAAFDPWRKTSALAALLGVAAPDLLAQPNE